jgi:hypothetical protein
MAGNKPEEWIELNRERVMNRKEYGRKGLIIHPSATKSRQQQMPKKLTGASQNRTES